LFEIEEISQKRDVLYYAINEVNVY